MSAAERPDPVPAERPSVPGYTLDVLLGRGGSGEVWRAVPRTGGPPVAVKLLVAGDPERQSREAALLGELDHPHLVQLHEVVHQACRGGPPRVALVLDLLPGGSLADLLARRRRLRPGEVVTALSPVAAALAHAHARGVIHGDLSPANILFTAEGRPVLTDLGVARVLGEDARGEVTPAYVDPTVARGGAPGPASDVFGIAAAAFHALTGVPPWNASGPAEILAVAASGDHPDLAELAPDAPADLLAVIRRGLAADPAERGSAAAFALDLRHACRPEPVRLPAPGTPDVEGPGHRARTELTHQVPGRRERAATPSELDDRPSRRRWLRRPRRIGSSPQQARTARHATARPSGGIGVRRSGRTHRRIAGLVLAVTVVCAGAWAIAHRAGPGAGATARAPRPAAASAPAGSDVAGDAGTGGESAADRQERPTTPGEWCEVVQALYDRRAQAFTTGRAALLRDVFTSGSPVLGPDERYAKDLAATGGVLRDFAPKVAEVTAVVGVDGGVALDVVDTWPDYTIMAVRGATDPVTRVAGHGPTVAHLVIARTPAGWRIAEAQRLGRQ